MREIIVSDGARNALYVTYLYHAVVPAVQRTGGSGEIMLAGERAAMRLKLEEELLPLAAKHISEVIAVGYKYRFLQQRLRVALGERERRILCAALIAADAEGDEAYIRRRIAWRDELCLDGLFRFRLGPLAEKWEHVISYIPPAFSLPDLRKFCRFLIAESKRRVYLKEGKVFGERFVPLQRSRLLGREGTEEELVLADAGYVCCLSEVHRPLEQFLQNYYGERALFS